VEMTSKQRLEAAFRFEPVDHLPFWPKFDAAYAPYQRGRFREMSLQELHRWCGSDEHAFGPACFRPVHQSAVVEHYDDGLVRRETIHADGGTLTDEWHFDVPSHAWHPLEFLVRRPEDIDVLLAATEDLEFEFAPEQHAQALKETRDLGDGGIMTCSLGTSPFMDWIEHIAGVANGYYLLYDHPDRVEKLFDALHAANLRRLEVILTHCPIDVVYSIENTSTTLMSPAIFRRYCYPYLVEYCQAINDAGKMPMMHMCGTLHGLLDQLATLPTHGFEAFTSAPVGDTAIQDGRKACPDSVFLGGTNATLWLEPADEIIRVIKSDLDALPHHRGIVMTSGGVMPPPCPPDTIRRVRDWLASYPVRV